MGDTRRTRDDRSLAPVLASQLNAIADDWSPEDRHPGRISNIDHDEDPFDPMALIATGRHVWVDDMDALIVRSFDYEAAERLTCCRCASRSRDALGPPKGPAAPRSDVMCAVESPPFSVGEAALRRRCDSLACCLHARSSRLA